MIYRIRIYNGNSTSDCPEIQRAYDSTCVETNTDEYYKEQEPEEREPEFDRIPPKRIDPKYNLSLRRTNLHCRRMRRPKMHTR